MKFILTLSNDYVKKGYFRDILTGLGFKFNENSYCFRYAQEDILFDISSLSELMDLQKQMEFPLILVGNEIEIYNGYRE